MVDERFFKIKKELTFGDVLSFLELETSNYKDLSTKISGVASIIDAANSDITFLENRKYFPQLSSTKAAFCLISEQILEKAKMLNIACVFIPVSNPYFAYSKLLRLFYEDAMEYKFGSAEQSAYISSSAKIGHGCYVGHNVVIQDSVAIGDGSIIESGTFIGHGVQIGKNARIGSNVSIKYSIIGDDVVILSGAKIGQDGFGFATEAGKHNKIFHIGRVLIGNDVEIGANTTIDRGSLNDTIIEDFCRIDNLVQIGHNVKIGRGSIIVAQVGIAGSVTIGNYCAVGGQAGIAGHLDIGDFSQIAGKSGVMQNLEPKSFVGGSPAVSIRDWHRQTIMIKKLLEDK
jgi:UDP-3-O-[3-hydroxymyristoyl] glucosamine N-acyltransferase